MFSVQRAINDAQSRMFRGFRHAQGNHKPRCASDLKHWLDSRHLPISIEVVDLCIGVRQDRGVGRMR